MEKLKIAKVIYRSSELTWFFECPHCKSENISQWGTDELNHRYCPDCGKPIELENDWESKRG